MVGGVPRAGAPQPLSETPSSCFPVRLHSKRTVPQGSGLQSWTARNASPQIAEVSVVRYHWRELPRVSFLSRQSMTFVATKVCLSWQSFCHFVTTACLSRQRFRLDKHTFVLTKDVFCHNKHVFAATEVCLLQQIFFTAKLLSWQAYFCCNKRRVLYQQTCFVSTNVFCINKRVWFAVTKMVLFAAPASFSMPLSAVEQAVQHWLVY